MYGGFLQRPERNVVDAKLGGGAGRSHGWREAGHESGLPGERSEPCVLELPCTDVGSDTGNQPPASEFDFNGINLLVDCHEGLGMHVEIDVKVETDRTVALFEAQPGSDFNKTGKEGLAALRIRHFERDPVG